MRPASLVLVYEGLFRSISGVFSTKIQRTNTLKVEYAIGMRNFFQENGFRQEPITDLG